MIQASQIVEGCKLSCFYPMLQNNHLNLTFLIVGPTGFIIFCFKKKAGNNSLSLVFHPQDNVLLVTDYLGGPSLLLSILRLPSHCLVWLAFPSSSSLPSFHVILQPSFFLWTALFFLSFHPFFLALDSPLFLLFRQPSFHLVHCPLLLFYSPLFTFGQPSFSPFGQPSFSPYLSPFFLVFLLSLSSSFIAGFYPSFRV